MDGEWLLDDFRDPARACGTGTAWRCITDRVMGGVSEASAMATRLDGRPVLRLQGQVSLDNNGGFVQLALDLAAGGGPVDARAYRGVALTLHSDGRHYRVHLRSADCRLPWQSYRASVAAAAGWHSLQLPFTGFLGHRLEVPLDLSRLRRIGLVALGEAGPADVALARIAFYL